MAELAAAGSVVGLITLGIQSCQGLTSYYTAFKSVDDELNQAYQVINELRITCENLEGELQRTTHKEGRVIQQVVRLIASCQDGMETLRSALDRCSSSNIPQSLAGKLELYRIKMFYPFRKQTLRTLKDTVHSTQVNLGFALQILQLHVSAGLEQELEVLFTTSTDIKAVVQNNGIGIQELVRANKGNKQDISPLQKQAEDISINVETLHHEVRHSRQDVLSLRENVHEEFTALAQHANGSQQSIEATVARNLARYGVEMNELRQEMKHALLEQSLEVKQQAARMESLRKSITSLQLGVMAQPALMRSVCDENHRFELSTPDTSSLHTRLRLQNRDRRGHARCNCQSKHLDSGSQTSSKSSHFGIAPNPRWKLKFQTESSSHHRTCPLFRDAVRTTVAKFSIGSCWTLLAGAIQASISVTRGAGGFSISPSLQCAYVVPPGSAVFELVRLFGANDNESIKNVNDWQAFLQNRLNGIGQLFDNRKASPYDVDHYGNTLLHDASSIFSYSVMITRLHSLHLSAVPFVETMIWFYRKLGEFGVPLNWTNDFNQTFMDQFVMSQYTSDIDHDFLCNSATQLLESGAEFGSCSDQDYLRRYYCRCTFAFAGSMEVLDGLGCSEISISVLRRSVPELLKSLQEWPQLINHGNKLAQTPLHLAVGWPFGVQVLLAHGSDVDAHDLVGNTPVEYAISRGFVESIGLLMKANGSLDTGHTPESGIADVLSLAAYKYNRHFDSREAVLKTIITVLAERRRDLESQLAATALTRKDGASWTQNDRVLDAYAPHAERLLERNGVSLPTGSTILTHLRTVYHTSHLTVEIAEKLWQAGFRDIDIPAFRGRTPLMFFKVSSYYASEKEESIVLAAELITWLVQKGAKLHRPQVVPLDDDPITPRKEMDLPPTILALHYVAAIIGELAVLSFTAGRIIYLTQGLNAEEISTLFRSRLQTSKHSVQSQLNRLGPDQRQILATVLSDRSYDNCSCACSSRGCLASTMMLKRMLHFEDDHIVPEKEFSDWSLQATEFLIDLVGPQNACCWEWLAGEIVRFHTFRKLELRHTCCEWHNDEPVTELEQEEIEEIRDEDHDGIQLLESLLHEFEEKLGDQVLITFLKGYWAERMQEVLEHRGELDKTKLREIGVILYN